MELILEKSTQVLGACASQVLEFDPSNFEIYEAEWQGMDLQLTPFSCDLRDD